MKDRREMSEESFNTLSFSNPPKRCFNIQVLMRSLQPSLRIILKSHYLEVHTFHYQNHDQPFLLVNSPAVRLLSRSAILRTLPNNDFTASVLSASNPLIRKAFSLDSGP
jgi:hypothetical protein